MTLSDARHVRDRIRESGIHCTVPTGYAPDGYFARIITPREPGGVKDFYSEKEWVAWRVKSLRSDIKRRRELDERLRPRSPIEILIDRACGYKPGEPA